MLERDIKRPFSLEKTLNFFFSYKSEKKTGKSSHEIFRQMTINLTLTLDVPVRPMDTKGLMMIAVLILT